MQLLMWCTMTDLEGSSEMVQWLLEAINSLLLVALLMILVGEPRVSGG